MTMTVGYGNTLPRPFGDRNVPVKKRSAGVDGDALIAPDSSLWIFDLL